MTEEKLAAEFQARRKSQPAKLIVNFPIAPLPARLWEQLVIASGIARDTRWAALSGASQHKLIQQLLRSEFPVTGKSLNKDEFVTCGGVRLSEVNFKTMESKICPGLFFAGEVLDIDGITGGFNFQAAWTTGWIAGRAMADELNGSRGRTVRTIMQPIKIAGIAAAALLAGGNFCRRPQSRAARNQAEISTNQFINQPT